MPTRRRIRARRRSQSVTDFPEVAARRTPLWRSTRQRCVVVRWFLNWSLCDGQVMQATNSKREWPVCQCSLDSL
jgi:hypothetical protein